MTSISVTKISNEYVNVYQSFFQSLKKYNKYFEIKDKHTVYLINNGHLDLGAILVDETYGYLNISIFQAPKVCKLSIISLIESSVIIAKRTIHNSCNINFKLVNATSYNFKFKLLFNDFIELEDCIQIDTSVLKDKKEEEITFREITFLDF